MRVLRIYCGMVLAGLACLSAAAEDGITPQGKWQIDVRGFMHRSDEDRSYFSGQWRYGLAGNWDIAVRGTVASIGAAKTAAAMRSGGSDIEVHARYALPQTKGLIVGGGVSLPNTPAQNRAFWSGSVEYALPMEESKIRVHVGAKGVGNSEDSIVGIYGGFATELAANWELSGDLTAIIRGNNTRESLTGFAARRAVYTFGVGYRPTVGEDQVAWGLFLGLSNSLGLTTGTSLSAALGNRPALVVGFSLRGRS